MPLPYIIKLNVEWDDKTNCFLLHLRKKDVLSDVSWINERNFLCWLTAQNVNDDLSLFFLLFLSRKMTSMEHKQLEMHPELKPAVFIKCCHVKHYYCRQNNFLPLSILQWPNNNITPKVVTWQSFSTILIEAYYCM